MSEKEKIINIAVIAHVDAGNLPLLMLSFVKVTYLEITKKLSTVLWTPTL